MRVLPPSRAAIAVALVLVLVGCSDAASPPPLEEGVSLTLRRPIVLADDVLIPRNDPRFEEVVFEDDERLRFRFEGGPTRAWREGLLVVGNEGPGYMGRVVELAVEGDERVVRLAPVGLDEVVEDGAFELSLELGDLAREGELELDTDAGVGAVESALGRRVALVPGEFFDGAGSCAGSRGITGGVQFSHSLETRSLRTNVIFDTEGFDVRRAGVEATGLVATTLTFEADGEIDVRCMLDVLELLRARGVPLGEHTFTRRVDVGPLPLSFSVTVSPRMEAGAIVVVEPSKLRATFEGRAELDVGAIYDRGTGFELTHELERHANASLDVTGPGSASAEVQFRSGVDIGLTANLLQLPTLGARLDAHAWIRTDDVECGYQWEAAASGDAHVTGPVGVDLGFFSHTFTTLAWQESFEAVARGGGRSLPWCSTTDCSAATTCTECNGSGDFESCGWCPSENRCLPVGTDGASICGETAWTRLASCTDCATATTEAECGRTSECSWCPELDACVNAAWCATIPSECNGLREARACEDLPAAEATDDATLSCVSEETSTSVRHGECSLTSSANGMTLRTPQFCVCRNGDFDCDDLLACGFADGSGGIGLIGGGSEPLLPTRGQLAPVRLHADRVLFASNNPEVVHTPGVVASTVGGPGTVRLAPAEWLDPGYPRNAPAARTEGSTSLDPSCPNGSVRELDVYVAHILASGSGLRGVTVGVVPVEGRTLDVTVEGALEDGPWNRLRYRDFVSARLSRDFFFGSGSSRVVRAVCGSGGTCGFTPIQTTGSSGYIDGRMRLVSDGCFEVWVTANDASGPPSARPTRWSVGNVAWPGWYGGAGAGRSSGVYDGGVLTARENVRFDGALQSRGFALGLAETAQPARMRLADSSEINFGDYGGLYDVTFDVTNESDACLLVSTELVSYASLQPTERPTFGVFNARRGDLPQIYWNSTAERSGGSDGTQRTDVILHAERDSSRPNAIVPSLRNAQHTDERLEAGASRSLRLRVTSPGMITAPLAVVVSSRACAVAPTPRPTPPMGEPPLLPEGASCTHSLGGVYGNLACSPGYQCCEGRWRSREACGACTCTEATGRMGCGG
ncbi:MAG: hypothetical protein H6721_09240 [Sandaracinus sp.]|nr:hypothetical protein [Sandaracinus sp.]MCB9621803.1 hypothetical protein [Sandaracinus sp.]MCB9632301.1 hypothetical protein [Sandaracinus sp.]